MRHIWFLAISLMVLGVGAKVARADEVVVEEGHRGHRDHAVVVDKRWHHKHWRHVVLAPEFVTYLGPFAFAGPGYHLVNVHFANGMVYRRAYVYDRNQIELPPRFDGRRIVRIDVIR